MWIWDFADEILTPFFFEYIPIASMYDIKNQRLAYKLNKNAGKYSSPMDAMRLCVAEMISILWFDL